MLMLPSAFRAESMLAICPTAGALQEAIVGRTQLVPVIVLLVITEVMLPRVAVWTVTEEEEVAVTTPVTSSIKSICPEDKEEAASGSVAVVTTFAAVRSTFVTACVPAFTVSVLLKLIRACRAACCLAEKVMEKLEVAGAPAPVVIWATLPALQPGVPVVSTQ